MYDKSETDLAIVNNNKDVKTDKCGKIKESEKNLKTVWQILIKNDKCEEMTNLCTNIKTHAQAPLP